MKDPSALRWSISDLRTKLVRHPGKTPSQQFWHPRAGCPNRLRKLNTHSSDKLRPFLFRKFGLEKSA
jgi:hypothetical protein